MTSSYTLLLLTAPHDGVAPAVLLAVRDAKQRVQAQVRPRSHGCTLATPRVHVCAHALAGTRLCATPERPARSRRLI